MTPPTVVWLCMATVAKDAAAAAAAAAILRISGVPWSGTLRTLFREGTQPTPFY